MNIDELPREFVHGDGPPISGVYEPTEWLPGGWRNERFLLEAV